MSLPLEQLQTLRDEMSRDIQLCQTRDQHIRMVQYLARLDLALEQIRQLPVDIQKIV